MELVLTSVLATNPNTALASSFAPMLAFMAYAATIATSAAADAGNFLTSLGPSLLTLINEIFRGYTITASILDTIQGVFLNNDITSSLRSLTDYPTY
jgi:hypothetical protein